MLTLKKLPFRNLQGYSRRTAALMLFAALMTVAVFGGATMVQGVDDGLNTVQARLGADILVTPESADSEFDAQTALLQAEPGYFYMDKSKLTDVEAVAGVEKASPQLFLASSKSGCCSVRVQMIAFDPETDFTIQPWIADTSTTQKMGLMDVIVGSNVNWTSIATDGKITFYDSDCEVIGQFAPTGSTLDSAVYMNFDTVKALIKACQEKGLMHYKDLDADKVISSVLVKVTPGYDVQEVADAIRSQVSGVNVATTTNMVSGIADSLRSVSHTISGVVIALWALGLVMLVLLFSLMIGERRREFASLRAMGASRHILSGIVTKEAMTIGLTGGAIGVLITLAVVVSFHTLIGERLGTSFLMPSARQLIMWALIALATVAVAAAIAAGFGVRRVSRMDASLELKEGE